MTDPIEDIIGDYRAFVAQQRDRLLSRGIDIAAACGQLRAEVQRAGPRRA